MWFYAILWGCPRTARATGPPVSCPPVFQGTQFRPTGSPILNLKPEYQLPSAVTDSARGLLHQLDELHRSMRPLSIGRLASLPLTRVDVSERSIQRAEYPKAPWHGKGPFFALRETQEPQQGWELTRVMFGKESKGEPQAFDSLGGWW